VKAGDAVRLIAVPANLKDDRVLQTRTLFEKCLGKTFPIAALEAVNGLPYPLVRLDVGQIVGEEAYMQTIWVEPEYLQLENLE
jgi:hypothetical protein